MARQRAFLARLAAAAIMLLSTLCISRAQANYDESKIRPYTLPDVLTCEDGTRVTSARQWEKKRRPEILQLLSEQEYGVTPKGKVKTSYEVLAENPQALGGKATSQEVMFTFSANGHQVKALLAVYVPNARKGKVPVFIAYNFPGNRSATLDNTLMLSPHEQRPLHPKDNLEGWKRSIESYPIEDIVSRGYAIATMDYQDIFPDNPDGGSLAVTALFPENAGGSRWQALGAWAWGSSRIADWVEKQPWANRKQLIVIGHSRQGKAALWAGAQDKRFSVTISNNSGCGGAALSKRAFGETVGAITKSFPHWFCPVFSEYSGREQDLPFDQHELIALMAPRHVYVASAEDDLWADPKGEYLAALKASPVWGLYGKQGLTSETPPTTGSPVMTDVGYHIRPGGHGLTPYDWTFYMDFCDKVFGR